MMLNFSVTSCGGSSFVFVEQFLLFQGLCFFLFWHGYDRRNCFLAFFSFRFEKWFSSQLFGVYGLGNWRPFCVAKQAEN